MDGLLRRLSVNCSGLVKQAALAVFRWTRGLWKALAGLTGKLGRAGLTGKLGRAWLAGLSLSSSKRGCIEGFWRSHCGVVVIA